MNLAKFYPAKHQLIVMVSELGVLKILDPKAWDPMETMGFGMVSTVYQCDVSDACICSTNSGVYFKCILQTVEVCSFQCFFFLLW